MGKWISWHLLILLEQGSEYSFEKIEKSQRYIHTLEFLKFWF
jgi:hypothetical protein